MYLPSIDWFKGKIRGKSHRNHGTIWLVSGLDFPFFVNPLIPGFFCDSMVLYDFTYVVSYGENLSDYYWLVVEPTPLKNMSLSIGMMTFPTYGEKEENFPNHQPATMFYRIVPKNS